MPAEAWRRLQSDADRFGAGIAAAAATASLAEYEEHPEHDLWAAVSGGSTRMELLQARVRAAASVPGKIRVLTSALLPNRDHLRMALQREPRFADYMSEMSGRVEDVGSGIVTALRKQFRR
ncbi:hypothetical protein ABIB17_003588 [Arthrobacter sp. UYEF6]